MCLDVYIQGQFTVKGGACHKAAGWRKNGTERVWKGKSGTQNITLVFHSNHLKMCARKTFIMGIHSCQKKRF